MLMLLLKLINKIMISNVYTKKYILYVKCQGFIHKSLKMCTTIKRNDSWNLLLKNSGGPCRLYSIYRYMHFILKVGIFF